MLIILKHKILFSCFICYCACAAVPYVVFYFIIFVYMKKQHSTASVQFREQFFIFLSNLENCLVSPSYSFLVRVMSTFSYQRNGNIQRNEKHPTKLGFKPQNFSMRSENAANPSLTRSSYSNVFMFKLKIFVFVSVSFKWLLLPVKIKMIPENLLFAF